MAASVSHTLAAGFSLEFKTTLDYQQRPCQGKEPEQWSLGIGENLKAFRHQEFLLPTVCINLGQWRSPDIQAKKPEWKQED